ncbi:haloacid dehalogenase superfamily, subfamily IA, variant 3 with third motif having DD or ED/haloacid dehalogenase superfamily, subfamily IA, variant 1 with third motif having Dx(3-4)D or Dx(3-4)E [Agreia bicolorata]|uniref:Haloacid dehalogenase superfamily, subfamily IA, variant 3 with third motif having DD or ED/haloacid dehalogenase superfamily, subfamily IA, variant 1 with third motif having Dx(3-4)D or Dx(3-4)E n=1 Tax=Agreia bicolorata TaxID=110935 RepID=A0A1T4Y3G9_9MICO|nr:HAD family hydrolase [Agreia bicolorata]SKA96352.1 haloacid dehalogenase superfamily, subfamily IA, variant 3 with third motif having DD or ED/haloacid dehalogenase superfamily, subfamily IA, variant 1 with third motif having Dx(3-4)D or Dx(3-4)E [Agreia bicolorata]
MDKITLPVGLRAIVFDVGETLVDESRAWSVQASKVGVTPFALMGALGALIDRGQDHRRVWDMLNVKPPDATTRIERADLYPDAMPCLRAARAAGLLVGIAGNQPAGAVEQLHALGFAADFIASSTVWRIAKPSPEFFSRIAQRAELNPDAILYVGDRLDNDVLPARDAGMRTAFLRRGPWGYIHAQREETKLADVRLDSLTQLAAALS